MTTLIIPAMTKSTIRTEIKQPFPVFLGFSGDGCRPWFWGDEALLVLSVGVLFYIALYAIGVLFGAEATLGLYDLMKFSLCVLVGILSGMLGINLGRD